MSDSPTFAELFDKFLREQNLTAGEVSKRTQGQVSPAHVQKLRVGSARGGIKDPRWSTVMYICLGLKVSPMYFCPDLGHLMTPMRPHGGTDEPPPMRPHGGHEHEQQGSTTEQTVADSR